MAINPMMLMKMKSKLEGFNARHPKLRMFFADVFGRLDSGDVLEISVTKADGHKIKTNIRVSDEDVELLGDLTLIISSQVQNNQQ